MDIPVKWNTLPKYYFLTFIQQLLHDVLLYKMHVHNRLYGLDNFGSSNLGMYAPMWLVFSFC